MKKWLSLLLVLVLVLSLAACSSGGNNAGNQGNSQENTGNQGNTQEEEVYKLVLSYYASDVIPPGQAVKEAIKYAEEKSNGRLQFDAYFSGTYVNKTDTMAALATGLIDISPCDAAQIASVSILNQVFNALIQADLPERRAVQDVYVRMIKEIPELNEEMLKNSNCFWLYPFVMGGHNLHGNVRIETVSDFKGNKVEAKGTAGQYVNLMGGTAVELDSGDYYNGMKLGTVDAQFMHWAAINNYQVNEVVKYHTIFGASEIGSGIMMPAMGYFMNQDSWNKLPPDLQQILYDAFVVGANYCLKADEESFQQGVDYAHENGHEFIFITGEARKEWAGYMSTILEEWFANCTAAGYDGKRVYDKMCEWFEAN